MPWGSPRYNIALILSILSVAFVSTIDSVGDYHACASVAEAPSPPYHAVNRGQYLVRITLLAIEGLSTNIIVLKRYFNAKNTDGKQNIFVCVLMNLMSV